MTIEADSRLEKMIRSYVERRRDRLVEIVRDLVSVSSENTPPTGKEASCQAYVAGLLRNCGCSPLTYDVSRTPGIREHKLFWPGRDYANRPNVAARKKGRGGGRSLIFSGHVDTVPVGTQSWKRPPFGAVIEGDRLYGRGSNDMKGGVAASLFAVEALAELELNLCGDLVFESVVDEEFGGSNGTLAGRLAGYSADAAIVCEPTSLRICPAQRGGQVAHILLRASSEGILNQSSSTIARMLGCFMTELPKFQNNRREQAGEHPLYLHDPDPVPVTVTKVSTGPWGFQEPITYPAECSIELYWQSLPGESPECVKEAFDRWFVESVSQASDVFPETLVTFPIRAIPGSAISPQEPLVIELAASAHQVLGKDPPIVGIEAPADLYVFHHFGIPAVFWGPCGGNTHSSDEYVEIESVVAVAQTLLLFACRWCGVSR